MADLHGRGAHSDRTGSKMHAHVSQTAFRHLRDPLTQAEFPAPKQPPPPHKFSKEKTDRDSTRTPDTPVFPIQIHQAFPLRQPVGNCRFLRPQTAMRRAWISRKGLEFGRTPTSPSQSVRSVGPGCSPSDDQNTWNSHDPTGLRVETPLRFRAERRTFTLPHYSVFNATDTPRCRSNSEFILGISYFNPLSSLFQMKHFHGDQHS